MTGSTPATTTAKVSPSRRAATRTGAGRPGRPCGAAHGVEALGGQADEHVAPGVAEGVGDLVEQREVDDGDRTPVPELLPRRVQEALAVAQPGQGVVVGVAAQALGEGRGVGVAAAGGGTRRAGPRRRRRARQATPRRRRPRRTRRAARTPDGGSPPGVATRTSFHARPRAAPGSQRPHRDVHTTQQSCAEPDRTSDSLLRPNRSRAIRRNFAHSPARSGPTRPGHGRSHGGPRTRL